MRTDKGGFIYVFDLEGGIVPNKSVSGLKRMNNVDIEYGLIFDERSTDVAVATSSWSLPTANQAPVR